MKQLNNILASLGLVLFVACGGSHDEHDGHTHADGEHDHAEEGAGEADEDHDHEEVSLGTLDFGDLKAELAQAHGGVAAGKEGQLVVKLPYTDGGSTLVRAWIGTDDRTGSLVGKGEYAKEHDDYDIHADAPSPLPENTLWWVEVEKPDGTKLVGSMKPIFE